MPRYRVSTPSAEDSYIIVEDTQTDLKLRVDYHLGLDREEVRNELYELLNCRLHSSP